jgi:hypothetical protein
MEPALPREVPTYKGALDAGAVSHVNGVLAVRARASPEAMDVVVSAPPLFVRSVARLLRLVRPLSFTQ